MAAAQPATTGAARWEGDNYNHSNNNNNNNNINYNTTITCSDISKVVINRSQWICCPAVARPRRQHSCERGE